MATTKDIQLLTSDNYHAWRRNMEFLLQSKGLWDVVNVPVSSTTTTSITVSTPVKGQDPGKGKDKAQAKDAEFFKNDSKARGIIGLAISADIQPVIENCPSAYEAWWALADHFALVAKSNKMYYQVLLFKTEMKSNETLVGYLNSIIWIHNNLRGFGVLMDEFMLCCKVISSLTEKYTAIAQTLMQTPDNTMSLNYLNAQFAMEDAHQKIAGSTGTGKSGEGKGQALQTSDKDKNKDKEITCFRCKKKGHRAENCYAKLPNDSQGCGQGRGQGCGQGCGQARGHGRGNGRGNGKPESANETNGKDLIFMITDSEIYSENSEIFDHTENTHSIYGKLIPEGSDLLDEVYKIAPKIIFTCQ